MLALLYPRAFRLARPLARAMSSVSPFVGACPLTITPAQLQSLDPASVAILDASWHMPAASRDPRHEWLAMHIPGARFLDLDEVASPHALGLKHMMPSPAVFAKACETFGITPKKHVILYDTHGIFSSPRALFMFRALGHTRSSVLDGGLPAWVAHGCPTESGRRAPLLANVAYPAPKLDARVVKSYEQVVSNSKYDPSLEPLADIVVDARSHERYLGTVPEPRPGLPSGHIPHAYSLPFQAFLDTHPLPNPIPVTALPRPVPIAPGHAARVSFAAPRTPAPSPDVPIPLPSAYTTLKPSTRLLGALQDALGPALAEEVLQGRRGVVASCGSGMTAAVLWLGMQMLGVERVGVYDESWTGYAMRKQSEIAKGEEKRGSA